MEMAILSLSLPRLSLCLFGEQFLGRKAETGAVSGFNELNRSGVGELSVWNVMNGPRSCCYCWPQGDPVPGSFSSLD